MGFHFGHRNQRVAEVHRESALGVSTSARVPKDANYDAGKAKIISSRSDQIMSTSNMMGQGSSTGNMQLGPVSLNIDLDPLLTGFSYNTHDIHLYDIYRDMYFFDPVPGGITDLYSTLPFSPYTFGGAKDSVLEPYYAVNETLRLESLLPRISIDHLVTGTYISSLVCEIEKKEVIDIMAHRMDQIKVTPIPFMGEDPIMELNVPPEFNEAFSHKSPRIRKIIERYGNQFINKLRSGTMELDPMTTLYLPRRSFSYEEGTSFFRRILPLWLIEKNLYRGTLIESGRRQRGILQIQMGDGGDWEPSVEEMEFMTDMVLAADADPIGSVITTRLGVNFSEFRCVVGSSLIHTANGLQSIASLVEHDPETLQPDTQFALNIKVKSLAGKFQPTMLWHYRGYGDVYKTTTQSGTEIRTTVDHKFVTVGEDAELTVKPVCDIHADDGYVLLENNGIQVDYDQPLNLQVRVEDRYSEGLRIPRKMTKNLAWLLGILVSEGYVSDRHGVTLVNTDLELLDRVKTCLKSVFNVDADYKLFKPEGVRNIKGKDYACKDLYKIVVRGKTLVDLLRQLGMGIGGDIDGDKRPSYYYEVPKAILEGSYRTKLAFLAAYFDGDGSVLAKERTNHNTVEMKIYSQSKTLIQQMKIMLGDMGFRSRIEPSSDGKGRLYISPASAAPLYNAVSKYMACSRKVKFESCSNHKQDRYGVPVDVFLPKLMERKVRSGPKGVTFLNDKGAEVTIAGFGSLFRHITHANTCLNYNVYAEGGYDDHLRMIALVSESLAKNLIVLLEHRYMFEKIAKFEADGKDHLYDLTMQTGKGKHPAFVCGLGLIRNSGGDMWKVTDIWDQTTQMKMKALGISESFLSDTTYDNQATGLNVFMEYMRTYRDQITRNLFYDKIFRLVSIMNGITVNRNGKVQVSSQLKGDYHEIQKRIARDGSRLFIPQVHWSKQMHPEVNQSALDTLRTMQELGIPPSLRAVAAAGGMNLEQLLSDADENIAIERRVMDYKKRMADLRKRYGLGDDQQSSMSSTSSELLNGLSSKRNTAVLGDMPIPSLASRNFDPEIVGRTVTGKKKYVHNQKGANEKINQRIYKSMLELSEGRGTPLTSTTVTPFKE